MKKKKILISWRFLKQNGQLGAKHWKYARTQNYISPYLKALGKGPCAGELCVNYGHGRKNEAPFNNIDELRLALGAFLEKNNIDSVVGDAK